jgi:protein-tyrosine phosphatase
LDSQVLNFSAVQVACFPFDDHNCPPLQLVAAFCQSAYSWLKEDLQNVVVVHCKAGMARTGLMITSLLLYLKVLLIMCACVGMRWHITNNHQVMTVQLHFVKIHAHTHIVIYNRGPGLYVRTF